MELTNIEKARELMNDRSVLLDVIEKSEKWPNGHFEFIEHCGNCPERICITYFPELEKRMIALIQKEVKLIEKELEKL